MVKAHPLAGARCIRSNNIQQSCCLCSHAASQKQAPVLDIRKCVIKDVILKDGKACGASLTAHTSPCACPACWAFPYC